MSCGFINGYPWNPWVPMESMGAHGFSGYPWNSRVALDSMGTLGNDGYTLNPWIPMDLYFDFQLLMLCLALGGLTPPVNPGRFQWHGLSQDRCFRAIKYQPLLRYLFGSTEWEDSHILGVLPHCSSTPALWEVFPCMGSLPIYGKSFHIWEDFQHVGSLPIHRKTSHIWENFPYMGSLPVYGKTSHVWENVLFILFVI
jgi:hypothetical protein